MRLHICVFIFLTYSLFSQNKKIDSLINLIAHDKVDTIMVYHLNKLCIEHYYMGDLNKCIELSQKIASISEKLNYNKGIYCAYDNLGSIYNETKNIPEALKHHFKALKLCNETTNKKDFALINCNISSVFISANKFKEAHNYCYAPLRIFKELKLNYEISNCYNNIGVINLNLKNYNLALGYFKLSLTEALKTNNTYYIANSYSALGYFYQNIKNYPMALHYYNLAFKIYSKIANEQEICLCLNNIALIYIFQNKLDIAELKLKQAINISEKNNDIQSSSDSYLDYSKIDSARSNYELAFQHYKKHITYNKNIINEESIEKSVQARMQYDFDMKQLASDSELKEEKLQLNNQKNKMIAFIIAIAITITLFFIYRNYKQKQRLEKLKLSQLELEKQLAENEMNLLRMQINPHLIFNTLNSINSFITSHKNIEAETYLIKFSKLLRATLNQINNQLITLQEELNTLTDYIELEQLRLNHSFKFNIIINEDIISSTKIPPLIIQPFVENAILHGLKYRNDGLGILTITITEIENQLQISILDNGIGRKKSELLSLNRGQKHVSKGITITTQRIELLKTKNKKSSVIIKDLIDLDNLSLGTEVVLTIPSDL